MILVILVHQNLHNIKKQAERTDKGASKPVKHHHKNKVMKNKDENQGTTMGNKVQPSEPEQAAPAGN